MIELRKRKEHKWRHVNRFITYSVCNDDLLEVCLQLSRALPSCLTRIECVLCALGPRPHFEATYPSLIFVQGLFLFKGLESKDMRAYPGLLVVRA
jgi:hypothetical protein